GNGPASDTAAGVPYENASSITIPNVSKQIEGRTSNRESAICLSASADESCPRKVICASVDSEASCCNDLRNGPSPRILSSGADSPHIIQARIRSSIP